MEHEKDKVLQQLEEESRNALVYIEAIPDTILTLHWRIYKFFNRNRSATYTNLHKFLSRINNNASKDAQKVGVAGTGFFIASDTLVTNIHVVALAKTVAAKQIKVTRTPLYLPDHKDLPYAYKKSVGKDPVLYTITGVIASDAENDLVLLRVAEKCDAPLSLGNSENVKVGDRVYTLAYANAEYQCVVGTISGRDSRGWFEITTQFFPGYSGSPVLNSNGEIIGIACSMDQVMNDGVSDAFGFGGAVPSNVLNPLFLNPLFKETEKMESFTRWQKISCIYAYAVRSQADRKQVQGKHKAAIGKYNLVLNLNPDFGAVYNNRGTAKSALGDHIGAIEDYNKAIQLSPSDPKVYYNRGRTKGLTGKSKIDQGVLMDAQHYYQMAIDDYTEVINQDPKYNIAYNNRGWVKCLLGQLETEHGNMTAAQNLYQEAVSDGNEALRLKPKGAKLRSAFFHTRGAAKAGLGDYNGAIEDFSESIQLNPKKALYYHDRGEAKEALGQHEEAIVDFQKAKELDPAFEK
ncbi:MAG: tetratricopeptide repeat-containing serine protease family protein [Candidatus Poribacteria bacterium]|nr:tetratricopeptide repeat-containing serine protease family protein [Candidatus Poribacteria bacterium]